MPGSNFTQPNIAHLLSLKKVVIDKSGKKLFEENDYVNSFNRIMEAFAERINLITTITHENVILL